jgi:uncharacterized membrane protein YdcZ (DUF606 family)
MLDALHAALEDRVEALDRVRSHIAANVFIGLMIDRLMVGVLAAKAFVPTRLIGMQCALAADVGAQDRQ